MVYGEATEYQGPIFRQVTTVPGGLRVWFDHAGGLKGNPEGFEVAGADRQFVTAHATIEHETVVVKAASVNEPVYVRYAWSNVTPEPLYNAEGLPASTFTSERFPIH